MHVDRFRPGPTPAPAARAGRPLPAAVRGGLAAASLPAVAAGLGAMLTAPLAVAALRLFDPLELAGSAAGWLPSVTSAIVALLCAGVMLQAVTRGLRSSSPVLLLRAGAAGSLATGLAIAAGRGVSDPATFPDPALSVGAAVAGALLAGAALVPARMPDDYRWATGSMALLFAGLELVLAAALLLPPSRDVAAWLFVAGAGMAAVATASGPWLAAGLASAGMVALAASRPGALEALAGLASLAAAAAALSLRHDGPIREAVAAPPGEPWRAASPRQPAPLPLAAPSASPSEPSRDEEATRLARELRGTIAELLQVRRTVALQRDEILRLETVDALTGVASRRAILDRLASEAAEARRYPHPLAVLLLDVDGFTSINREHGMGVGDEVLREVALRLRLRTRVADALGRAGADSFLLLLPHTDEAGVVAFADALLRRLLSRPVDTYDGELRVAVSIGVAFMRPGMALTDDELLAEADLALASARAAGGNRVAFDRRHGLLRLDDRRARQGHDEGQPGAADSTT